MALKAFRSLKQGTLTIKDLMIKAPFGETFYISEDDLKVSSDMRGLLRNKWVEEVVETALAGSDAVASSPSAPAAAPETTQDIRAVRRAEMGVLKRLKKFKEDHPGLIPEGMAKEKQLEIMHASELPELTDDDAPVIEASYDVTAPDLGIQKDDPADADDDLSSEFEDEDELDAMADPEAFMSEDAPVKKVVAKTGRKAASGNVQAVDVDIEMGRSSGNKASIEALKASKDKKVKHNTAVRSALPDDWESRRWSSKVKFLKSEGQRLTASELQDIIDTDGQAVSQAAKLVLLEKKKAQGV